MTYVLGSTLFWTCQILNICFDFFPQRLLEENNNKYLLFKIQSSKLSTSPNWWATEDIRENIIKTEIAFFVSEKWNQISIEVDGSGNIGNHEQFHGKIWRLVLWYKLITCFHEFCNSESTIFFTEFYLFTFLWDRMFWNLKKIIDLHKTFPENWASKQSFFVLILTMA